MTAPHLVDNRATLYGARARWLAEQGIAEREIYFRFWGALDSEEVAIINEMLEAERE